ncbi:eukaryotic translation initiation factor 2A isoform X2 [Apium graveolens]|uniref:eukaryotic translation initiation factor 2A isoform X2 n=1 Tax=Apium graveolens TaxID=4045 RepID=UPI003D78F998
MADSSPQLEISVRESSGLTIWNGPPFSNSIPSIKLDKIACSSASFCENGIRLMVIKSDSGICIYDTTSFQEIRNFDVVHTLAATLSPCGTYLQTFQKPASPQEKNVTLWNVGSGDAVYQLFQKNMTKTTWPSIRFSSDEAVACRLATNEVQIFDATDFTKGIVKRIRVPGIAGVEISKRPGTHLAAFVPESKGMPASVQIFTCGKDTQSEPVARRSFFRCSTVQLNWNHGSTGLLVLVQSDVDKTNQSYYGETKLNYLTTDGTHDGLVPLLATVFDKKCNPLLELGTGPYNTIRWNPKGKFLCLAGFGNLPGDMVFWDYVEKKKVGTTKAEWSVTSEWSPDGRYFLTATTAPRMQVDNGIKIFHHNGSMHFKKMYDKLYQVDWKPESPDSFGEIADLAESIDSLKVGDAKTQAKGPKSSQTSTKSTSTNPAVQKPAAYRPPHAKSAAAVQAELFGGGPSAELSKNALKNKKKREKQREKKAAEAGGSST